MEAENKLALKQAVIGGVRGTAHTVSSFGLMLSWPIALSGFNRLSIVHTSCCNTEMEHSWPKLENKSPMMTSGQACGEYRIKKELNISHLYMGWLERISFQQINLGTEFAEFRDRKCLKRVFLLSRRRSKDLSVIMISFSSCSSICSSFESRWGGFPCLETICLKEFNLLSEWWR